MVTYPIEQLSDLQTEGKMEIIPDNSSVTITTRKITKVLVTGANGQLGRCISDIYSKNVVVTDRDTLSTNIPEFIFVTHNDLDICNAREVSSFISSNNIDCVVNCAAYTNVDKAEECFYNAYLVNTIGTEVLGTVCANLGVYLIHISTDYVFNGKKLGKYDTQDSTDPRSIYGLTKADGESALETIFNLETWGHRKKDGNEHKPCGCTVIRTQWLYSEHGNNFFTKMWGLIDNSYRSSLCDHSKDFSPYISVVDDQHGTPTYAGSLAEFIVRYVTYGNIEIKERYKIIHFSDEGESTWFDFAKAIESFFIQNIDFDDIPDRSFVIPVSTNYYNEYIAMRKSANRPERSTLDHSSLEGLTFRPNYLGYKPDHWMINLAKCVKKFLLKKEK